MGPFVLPRFVPLPSESRGVPRMCLSLSSSKVEASWALVADPAFCRSPRNTRHLAGLALTEWPSLEGCSVLTGHFSHSPAG